VTRKDEHEGRSFFQLRTQRWGSLRQVKGPPPPFPDQRPVSLCSMAEVRTAFAGEVPKPLFGFRASVLRTLPPQCRHPAALWLASMFPSPPNGQDDSVLSPGFLFSFASPWEVVLPLQQSTGPLSFSLPGVSRDFNSQGARRHRQSTFFVSGVSPARRNIPVLPNFFSVSALTVE